MSQEQTIRHEFLTRACQYLFGIDVRCAGFKHIGLGSPALQPVRQPNQSGN